MGSQGSPAKVRGRERERKAKISEAEIERCTYLYRSGKRSERGSQPLASEWQKGGGYGTEIVARTLDEQLVT